LLEHDCIHNVTALTVNQHNYQIWTSKMANECMDHDTRAHFVAVSKEIKLIFQKSKACISMFIYYKQEKTLITS
jgi:hypothetical protein